MGRLMSDNNKAVLAKKQAELKKKKIILHNNEEGYDKREAQASALIQKGKLTDPEKETLSVLQSRIEKYPGIIAKNKEYIATLEKEISELKKTVGKKSKNSEPEAKKAHKDTGKSTSKKPVPAKSAKTKVIKVKKCTTTKCEPKPKDKVKFIGKICITIDHLGTGLAKTSLQVVKELRGLKNSKGLNIPVPVTVFVTCRAGGKKMMGKPAQFKIKQTDRQAIATFTENDMKMIMDMKALGAEIGVHLLGTLDVKGLNEETAAQKQIDNINYIRTAKLNFDYKKYKKGTLVVGDVRTASYHGKGDEIKKVAGLKNTTVQNSFKCIRGVSPSKPKAKGLTKYTPVFYHTVDIKKNVEKNPKSVTHFFFHSHQTIENDLYEELLDGLKSGKYKAAPYCSK